MKCSSSDNYRPLLVTTTRNKSYISCENVKNRTLYSRTRGFFLPFDHQIHVYTYILNTLASHPYFVLKILLIEYEEWRVWRVYWILKVSSSADCDDWGPSEACPAQTSSSVGLVKVGSKFTDFCSRQRDFLDVDSIKYKYWQKNCAIGLQQSACIERPIGFTD